MTDHDRLVQIEKIVIENQRALRGHNNHPGMVGQIAVMEQKQLQMEKDVGKILANTGELTNSFNGWKKDQSGRMTDLETGMKLFKADCKLARELMGEKLVAKRNVWEIIRIMIVPVLLAVITSIIVGVLGV